MGSGPQALVACEPVEEKLLLDNLQVGNYLGLSD